MWRKPTSIFLYLIGGLLAQLLASGISIAQDEFSSDDESFWQELFGENQREESDPAEEQPPKPAQTNERQSEPAPYSVVPVAETNAETDDLDSSKPQTSRMLEEIIVTAQKREENLEDVPISIEAYSGEGLAVRGVDSTADLPRISAGLTVTTQVGYTVTYLRGLGSDAFLFADPSVVNYIDNVYYPFPLGQTVSFGDVERVEVLKGPQGTLFGRNAIGGAVNILTKNPPLDEVAINAKISTGSFDKKTARGSLGVPLTDSLAVKIAGFYLDGDSHIDGRINTNDTPEGQRLRREESDALQGKLLWEPTDWLRLNLNSSRIAQKGSGTLYAVNIEPSALATTAGVIAQDPYQGVNNEDIFFDQNIETLSGQLQFLTDYFDVKFLGSDQQIEVFQNYDFDGSEEPLVYFEIEPGISDVQTGEFQILSNNSSWGAQWLQWIAGVNYFKSKAGFERLILRALSTNLEDGDILGMPLVPPEVQAAVQAANVPLPTGDIETISLLGTESIGYFTQATANLGDYFALTLGGRYQEEMREVLRTTGGISNGDGTVTNYYDDSSANNPELRDTTYAFSPKVTLQYYPGFDWFGQNAQLFFTWQEATKSATYNVINFLDFNPEKVLPEEIRSFELGFKGLLFNGLARFNAALFHCRLKNPQVQVVSIFQGGVVSFENAQEAVIKGADFSLLTELFPDRIGGLVLEMNGAYLDSTYTQYENGTGFDSQGALVTNQDFSGNDVVRSPKLSGSASLSQTLNMPWGPLEMSVDYYYNGGYFWRAENSPTSEEKAYGVVGAHFSTLIAATGLRLNAFGRNLSNARYNYGRFITDFGPLDARAPKAHFGLELEYEL